MCLLTDSRDESVTLMTPFRRADEILADMQAEKAARIDALHAGVDVSYDERAQANDAYRCALVAVRVASAMRAPSAVQSELCYVANVAEDAQWRANDRYELALLKLDCASERTRKPVAVDPRMTQATLALRQVYLAHLWAQGCAQSLPRELVRSLAALERAARIDMQIISVLNSKIA